MKWTIKMVNYVKEKTGYKVIYVTTNSGDEVPSEWNTIYPTPNQFLGLIDKATLVMTNSFHGTVFSLIMEKNFISMARDKYLDKQNLRIKGLTKELGVENRFLEPYSKTQIMSSFLETDIDYKKVNKALAPLRDKSYRFLENAIK
jgi:cobyric acid synthase